MVLVCRMIVRVNMEYRSSPFSASYYSQDTKGMSKISQNLATKIKHVDIT